ncbi:MAG: LTA synthase family protein [Pseudoflavonifractor sp.]|nr:LTA synthase family protein [Pseudoflavonifractor sp.]
MSKPFFLQPCLAPDSTPGRQFAFWGWNVGIVALGGIGIGLASLLLALGPYSLRLGLGYLECPRILLLNLLPPVVMILLLYALTGRPGASFGFTAGVLLGLSAGNYYKLMFRDDPLMFGDLLLLKEVRDMAGKYRLFLDWKLCFAIAAVAAGWLLIHVLVRGKPEWGSRGRAAGVLLAATGAVLTMTVCLDNVIYEVHTAYYERLGNRWSSTQQYLARGFLYPFLHSINNAVDTPPADYNVQEAAEYLKSYADADIPEEKKVNVVGIMLEAYNDFTRFGVPELAVDVYDVWHALEAEGVSGTLVTNIFAGGTVDTERCFLTGSASLGAFRSDTNSYPWYFRSQGYTVEGMHPCYDWFYNRKNINENLGFENYAYVENYFSTFTGGAVAADDVFFRELLSAYQEGTEGNQPYFNFSVTYQGHGPYDSTQPYWGNWGDYVVNDGRYTDEEQCILENYLGSISNTNEHLKMLTDTLRTDNKPVVLVLFGDHNPWMGDGNSVYKAMGLDLDLDSQDGFLDYYSTRYIIWANDAAKAVLEHDFQGEGPTLGPSFLMNEVFRLCGWEGPAYLQAIDPVLDGVSVVHTSGRYLENGVLTTDLTAENAELVRRYRAMDYFWHHHFTYDPVN